MERHEQCLAHLRKLAEELHKREFRTELRTGAKPHLKVVNATTPTINERVLCRQTDDGSWVFWWPWQQPVGSVDDLETVVDKITAVLRSVEAEATSPPPLPGTSAERGERE